MASQIRMFNVIKGLSQNHYVDVIAKVPNKLHLSSEYTEKIKNICNEYFPILAPNRENNLKRAFYKIRYKWNNKLQLIPRSLFYNSIPTLRNKIAEIANIKKYDIINCIYWYSCTFINELSYRPYLAIDTNDLCFEKYESELRLQKEWENNRRKIDKYKELELKYTGLNDLIISISNYDYEFFKAKYPQKSHIIIPTGQELTNYLDYKSNSKNDKKILFYGSMSSQQNIKAFFRLFNNILPKVRSEIPEVELIVLGANPPDEIKKLHNGKSIVVSGYVEDIRKWISKAKIMILPLEIAAGFRSRVVEVMAMGVPVIGTHNALDSIEMINGVHGYITDSDEEMAKFAINLLNDDKLRNQMSKNCKDFVCRYSIENTYGKLSDYYSSLNL